MKKTVSIAKSNITINTMYDSLFNIEEYETQEIGELNHGQGIGTNDPGIEPRLVIETSDQDIEEERKISIRECLYEGIEYPNYSKQELENTAVYRKIADKINEYDAVVFHGSAVCFDNFGYIFTASSGVGKTTHTNLWIKNIKGSYYINGDKPIIKKIEDKLYVCGTPWMGKEKYGCNKIVELKGICFLERGIENKIEKTDFKSVMDKLIAQTYRPSNPDSLIKVMRLIEYIGLHTDLYKLECNMKDEAAFVSYNMMVGKK